MATQRTYTSEEAIARLHQLPEKAHAFIYSDEMNTILTQIGEAHKLHLDQLGSLEHEVVALMLGFTEPSDFAHFVEESLKLDNTEADKVAKDVNDLLLSKVQKEMMASSPTSTKPVSISPNQVPTPPRNNLSSSLPSSVDQVLTQPTIQLSEKNMVSPDHELTSGKQEVTPSMPNKYKMDPYREPIE